MNLYTKISEIINNNELAALCTVVSAKGSTPRGIGSKMIVNNERKIFGSIGGGVLEDNITDIALSVIKSSTPELVCYNLTKDLHMACGGSVEVFIEPLSNKFSLLIFGAGHIGKALAEYLTNMDFSINIIDEREHIFQEWNFDNCSKFNKSYKSISQEFKSNNETFIVIVTNSHESDRIILKQYINEPHAYIGLIGSKRKVEEIKKYFILNNIALAEQLEKIDMPIGLDILAEGPNEIAISIASKLILEKNKIKLEKRQI